MELLERLNSVLDTIWDLLTDGLAAVQRIPELLENLNDSIGVAIGCLPAELTIPALAMLSIMIPLAIIRWLT